MPVRHLLPRSSRGCQRRFNPVEVDEPGESTGGDPQGCCMVDRTTGTRGVLTDSFGNMEKIRVFGRAGSIGHQEKPYDKQGKNPIPLQFTGGYLTGDPPLWLYDMRVFPCSYRMRNAGIRPGTSLLHLLLLGA